jgi:DNA-binding PadR family transcriptional regulator
MGGGVGKESRLGELEELMLLAVLRLDERADGAGVREELETEAERSVSVSTVYVTMMRLEEKGYARSWKGEPTGERGGKARRLYAVTPEGLDALEAARDIRARLWQGIDPSASEASRG